MRQAKINQARAKRAFRCLRSDGDYELGDGIDAGITDLLGDLRHLCDLYELDFDDLSASGYMHYKAQVVPDNLERSCRWMFRRGRLKIP
jgi:hypothetical protein